MCIPFGKIFDVWLSINFIFFFIQRREEIGYFLLTTIKGNQVTPIKIMSATTNAVCRTAANSKNLINFSIIVYVDTHNG